MTDEQFERVYPVWVLWRATERRFLPSELMRQPQELMDGILLLDGLFETMLNQVDDRRRKKESKKK